MRRSAQGKAAPLCVWRLAVLSEHAILQWLACTALLLDIAKVFENAMHGLLAVRAFEFGFVHVILRFWFGSYQGPRRILANQVIGEEVSALNRTIVAGDSYTDLFMRMMVVPLIDKFLKGHPYTHPGMVADDVQVLTIGTPKC